MVQSPACPFYILECPSQDTEPRMATTVYVWKIHTVNGVGRMEWQNDLLTQTEIMNMVSDWIMRESEWQSSSRLEGREHRETHVSAFTEPEQLPGSFHTLKEVGHHATVSS